MQALGKNLIVIKQENIHSTETDFHILMVYFEINKIQYELKIVDINRKRPLFLHRMTFLEAMSPCKGYY